MSEIKERAEAAGVVVASGFFRIAFYVCIVVLLFWIGKSAYHFGYEVFNQQAVSPGEGHEVTVVINEDASLYNISKTLEKKGLVKDALVFFVQERLSNYHGKLQPGTYLLSTAYTPNRIMGILAGDKEQEGASAS
ncbi:MAG: solute-binding protein [Clostridia bacterium]|nr:solute-binding protein [Clostridia bacterium]MDY5554698.1 solute-binding protein [Blautia sp.]